MIQIHFVVKLSLSIKIELNCRYLKISTSSKNFSTCSEMGNRFVLKLSRCFGKSHHYSLSREDCKFTHQLVHHCGVLVVIRMTDWRREICSLVGNQYGWCGDGKIQQQVFTNSSANENAKETGRSRPTFFPSSLD